MCGYPPNFQNIFGISKFKIHMTGESQAGRYVLNIFAAMLDKNDMANFNIFVKPASPYGLERNWYYQGTLLYDLTIGPLDYVQEGFSA